MTDSDEHQNLPDIPEPATVVHALQMPVSEFEGEMVRIMRAKLPSDVLQMDFGYKRGTHLKIELEVEVIRVSIDEMRSGRDKGDLVRDHTLVLRQARILGAYTAEQMDEGVGGGLSAANFPPEPEPEDPAEPTATEEMKPDEFPEF